MFTINDSSSVLGSMDKDGARQLKDLACSSTLPNKVNPTAKGSIDIATMFSDSMCKLCMVKPKAGKAAYDKELSRGTHNTLHSGLAIIQKSASPSPRMSSSMPCESSFPRLRDYVLTSRAWIQKSVGGRHRTLFQMEHPSPPKHILPTMFAKSVSAPLH